MTKHDLGDLIGAACLFALIWLCFTFAGILTNY